MNLDALTKEIKEKVSEGTKPSDLKKKRGRPSKQNNGENKEQLRNNGNEIREWIKELDNNFMVFAAKLSEKVNKLEKNSQNSWGEVLLEIILTICSVFSATASGFIAYKVWGK